MPPVTPWARASPAPTEEDSMFWWTVALAWPPAPAIRPALPIVTQSNAPPEPVSQFALVPPGFSWARNRMLPPLIEPPNVLAIAVAVEFAWAKAPATEKPKLPLKPSALARAVELVVASKKMLPELLASISTSLPTKALAVALDVAVVKLMLTLVNSPRPSMWATGATVEFTVALACTPETLLVVTVVFRELDSGPT